MSTGQEKVDATRDNDLVDLIVSLARTEHLLSGPARNARRTEIEQLKQKLKAQLDCGRAAIKAAEGATDDNPPTQSHPDHTTSDDDAEYATRHGDDGSIGW
jgi:hypothetical protein